MTLQNHNGIDPTPALRVKGKRGTAFVSGLLPSHKLESVLKLLHVLGVSALEYCSVSRTIWVYDTHERCNSSQRLDYFENLMSQNES